MADYIGINVPKPIVVDAIISTSGTTSVICSGADFVGMGVQVGDTVLNITDTEFTTVTDVVSKTQLTVSPAGTFTATTDKICVLSATENILVPVRIESILTVNTGIYTGNNQLNLKLLSNETANDFIKVYIEDGGNTTSAQRNKITESFIASISNALAKGYQPNIVSTLALPDGAKYSYVMLDSD